MALQAHIIIPTSHPDASHIIDSIKHSLAVKFGGFSQYDGSGGWDGQDGLVEEDHMRLVVTANLDDMDGWNEEQFREYFRIEANYVKDCLDEEAVLIEFQDIDMELI